MPTRPTRLNVALPSPRPTDGGTPRPTSQPATSETPIRVIIGKTVLTGRLWDNATARDLIAQLPLTRTVSDFNGVEKIGPRDQGIAASGKHVGPMRVTQAIAVRGRLPGEEN